jgi:hypothetical protein
MQRTLWAFLSYTLVGPFLAAVLAAAYTPVAIWGNLAPFSAGDHGSFDAANLPDTAGLVQLMGRSALATFVWAPIAAGLTGLGVALLARRKGPVSRAGAGAIGVTAFFIGYVLAPFQAGELLALFALTAGCVAALIAHFLRRISVLAAGGGV